MTTAQNTSPPQHSAVSREIKELLNEKREAIECLRMIVASVRMHGPHGTTAYIISDGTMKRASEIVSSFGG